MADDDKPVRIRTRRNMIRAVNRELATFPAAVQETATAELARQLAREVDAGDRGAAGELRRTLTDLRKLARPPAAAAQTTPDEPEDATDELSEIERARADRLARAAGVVRSLGADHRRSGGRASG